MSTADEEATNDLEHFRVHFDSSSSFSPLSWIKVGEAALSDAVADLSANGTNITEQQVEVSNADVTRGLGYDLLIGIASDLASMALINFFAILVANIFAHHPRPEWVTLEGEASESDAEFAEVSFRADESTETIKAKIQAWVQHAAVLRRQLTIRMH